MPVSLSYFIFFKHQIKSNPHNEERKHPCSEIHLIKCYFQYTRNGLKYSSTSTRVGELMRALKHSTVVFIAAYIFQSQITVLSLHHWCNVRECACNIPGI